MNIGSGSDGLELCTVEGEARGTVLVDGEGDEWLTSAAGTGSVTTSISIATSIVGSRRMERLLFLVGLEINTKMRVR